MLLAIDLSDHAFSPVQSNNSDPLLRYNNR